MKRDPIRIDMALRQFIADAVAEKLQIDGIIVLVVSLTAKHLHVLAKFPKHNPRMQIGYAKKYATQQLKAHGLAVGFDLQIGEGIWAKRSHAEPVRNRNHQLEVFKYVCDHVKEGAKIWRFDA